MELIDGLTSEAGALAGVRVLELADELGEYCGKLLAGLGAEVIKVEPPDGEITRSYGPFLDDTPDPERSLYFWHYNFGKRGVTLDLGDAADRERLRTLARTADVVIDARASERLAGHGLGYQELRDANPALVFASISPFGADGPWSGFHGSDLIHLALGGIMMNCGYDPEPSGRYETPPIAPQMWQAYHVAGEMTALAILAALHHVRAGGVGQHLTTSVHEAVAQATEHDLPRWIYVRQEHLRQTGRHSGPVYSPPGNLLTKDGRWLAAYRTYLAAGNQDGVGGFNEYVKWLDSYGMAEDLTDARYRDRTVLAARETERHVGDVTARFVSRFLFSHDLWREAQARNQTWAPVRKPEENADDDHWIRRRTVVRVRHPELGRDLTHVGANWVSEQVPWKLGPRAPHLGEHNAQLLDARNRDRPAVRSAAGGGGAMSVGPSGKPFALQGIRVVDFGWMHASAMAGRFLASFGAEVIKVEHVSRLDMMRRAGAIAPDGGPAERAAATEPLRVPRPESLNRSGFFGELNAGKRAISLNLRTERGRELLAELIASADVVIEGFSPGALERMGFGFERLRELNPQIVYAAQSGMGAAGTYGPLRAFGQTAAALAGITDMSGLPEPYPPAGIGYSYLDRFGAYNLALAALAGLANRQRTGDGCHIDASQVDLGIQLTGTAVLDHSANGRPWRRYGNRSPYKPAAPHGAYPAEGDDRWIAIACFDEAQWEALTHVLGSERLRRDPRFARLADRIANAEQLDAELGTQTESWERYALMTELQRAGVPAGVCQTAEDRCEADPQLDHLGWLTELRQSEIGVWPLMEFPVEMTATPAYAGGIVDRAAPNYGEDNDYVFGEILGLTAAEVAELRGTQVI